MEVSGRGWLEGGNRGGGGRIEGRMACWMDGCVLCLRVYACEYALVAAACVVCLSVDFVVVTTPWPERYRKTKARSKGKCHALGPVT